MAIRYCDCGHPKRDHAILTSTSYGSCKICLCNTYKTAAPATPLTVQAAAK